VAAGPASPRCDRSEAGLPAAARGLQGAANGLQGRTGSTPAGAARLLQGAATAFRALAWPLQSSAARAVDAVAPGQPGPAPREDPMTPIDRSPAARRARAAAIALIAAAPALLALACQSLPPVSAEARDQAHYVRANSPIDWSSRTSGCSDARNRARRAARDRCEVAQLSSVADSCECRPGEAHAGSWRCSAVAAYVCSEDHIASRQ